MGSILNLINKLQALDTDKVIDETMEEITDDITEFNKKQLMEGFNNQGQRFRRYRSPKYARIKNEYNPLPGFGNPDLNLTGAFQSRITTRIEGQNIISDSSDPKNAELTQNYEGIYGLDDENKGIVIREKLRPAFSKNMNAATGLK